VNFDSSILKYGGAALLCAVICLPFASGCQEYGTVSVSAYQVATAVYSTCNRQDTQRLPVIRTKIDELHTSGNLTAKESNWLTAMVALADNGDWESAMLDARTMLDEQVQSR